MKVLVLGGTGAMGVHLVKLLSDNGIETVVSSRKLRVSEKNVTYLHGDAHNLEFLEGVLEQHWDVIIDFMVYKTVIFKERVDLLLESTSQYVFLSSSRVYAESRKPIVESSYRLLDVSQDEEFLSTDEYSLSKARQEDILNNSQHGNWTIIRPYITYSEDRLQLGVLEKEEWLYRVLKGRTIIFSNEMNKKFTTMTYGFDVAIGIMSIVGKESALGQAFHITANTACLWSNVLSIYIKVLEKHLGYTPKVLLQNAEEFLTWRPTKYQVRYDRFFDRKFNNNKISEYINVNSFRGVEIGLSVCLESFLEKPIFKAIDWKAEALKDKCVKEHTKLTEISEWKQKIKYLLFRHVL